MVTLREAPTNSPESHAILAEYFTARARDFPVAQGTYQTTFPDPAAFLPPRGVFLLVDAAVDDDLGAVGVVGCGGIRQIADGPHGTRYEVKHLFLRPEIRGRGWGRMLLADLERRAREWSASEMVLDTHHSLEAAGSLYARSGYVAIEPYNDNANATVWLRKVL